MLYEAGSCPHSPSLSLHLSSFTPFSYPSFPAPATQPTCTYALSDVDARTHSRKHNHTWSRSPAHAQTHMRPSTRSSRAKTLAGENTNFRIIPVLAKEYFLALGVFSSRSRGHATLVETHTIQRSVTMKIIAKFWIQVFGAHGLHTLKSVVPFCRWVDSPSTGARTRTRAELTARPPTRCAINNLPRQDETKQHAIVYSLSLTNTYARTQPKAPKLQKRCASKTTNNPSS